MRHDGRPLLFLDVDGVLNPFGPACPAGYTEHDLFPGEEPVRLNPAHGQWITDLSTTVTVIWATGWNEQANELLGPLLGVRPLPVLALPAAPFPAGAKVPLIASRAAARPAAWIDDVHTPEARDWARTRRAPTLLITVDPAVGLTCGHVGQVLDWARRLG